MSTMRFWMACSLAVLLACASGHNPVSTVVSTDANLPTWMFAYAGRLIHPSDGVYGVYYGAGIASDPEVVAHIDQVLMAVNDMTDGTVRFVRSMDTKAPLSITIDPSSPYAVDKEGWGVLDIMTDYSIARDSIGLRDRSVALSNVPLHEIGHFLFGPGHSVDADDIMDVQRASYVRLSFSAGEHGYWDTAQQYPLGSLLDGETRDILEAPAQSVGPVSLLQQILVE